MSSQRIVIVGAGGHAREVLEILLACRQAGQDVEPIGFIDDREGGAGILNGLPILGDMRWLEDPVDRDGIEVICALGTPSVCAKVAEQLREMRRASGAPSHPLLGSQPLPQSGKGSSSFRMQQSAPTARSKTT